MSQKRPPLENVLADWRGQAAVLRSNGHGTQATSLESLADAVAESMEAYLDWLTEDEAHLLSGWGVGKLRGHFPQWETQGMAKAEGTGRRVRRLYRRCILPRRANTLAAYREGLGAA